MNINKISIFGGYGFILTHFFEKYKDEIIRIEKNDVVPDTNNVLYGISTVSNYEVFDRPTLDIETNLLHFMDVLDACHKTYESNFTFNLISSWFTYGNTPDTVSEDSPCNPKGFYSITARCREQLLISYCETFGIKYRIFRLANVLGAGDKKASKKKNAIQFMIEELAKGNTIQLYKDPSYRNIIDVRDCVEIIHSLINNSPTNEIYNIGVPESRNVNDLIMFAQGMCGTGGIEMVDVPEFHKQVQGREFSMTTDKIKPYLPFEKFRPITETLEWIISEKRKLHENS